MCGIVGYIGFKEAFPILLKGLKRLEYRGYDSSGVVLLEEDTLQIFKKKGKVKELEQFVEGEQLAGNIGIGHTRWATHGGKSDLNSHPHVSYDSKWCLVHNGIVENYLEIKGMLLKNNISFTINGGESMLLTPGGWFYKPLEYEINISITEDDVTTSKTFNIKNTDEYNQKGYIEFR